MLYEYIKTLHSISLNLSSFSIPVMSYCCNRWKVQELYSALCALIKFESIWIHLCQNASYQTNWGDAKPKRKQCENESIAAVLIVLKIYNRLLNLIWKQMDTLKRGIIIFSFLKGKVHSSEYPSILLRWEPCTPKVTEIAVYDEILDRHFRKWLGGNETD